MDPKGQIAADAPFVMTTLGFGVIVTKVEPALLGQPFTVTTKLYVPAVEVLAFEILGF